MRKITIELTDDQYSQLIDLSKRFRGDVRKAANLTFMVGQTHQRMVDVQDGNVHEYTESDLDDSELLGSKG